jgi:hypothetical protein
MKVLFYKPQDPQEEAVTDPRNWRSNKAFCSEKGGDVWKT